MLYYLYNTLLVILHVYFKSDVSTLIPFLLTVTHLCIVFAAYKNLPLSCCHFFKLFVY